MNDLTCISDLPAGARALFEREQLAMPPVPAALAAALSPQGPTVFATRAFESSPYDLGHFLGTLEADPRMADYAVVAFDGHGLNSWAVHCYVVSGPLALFIQLPWGGAYVEAGPARAEIADVFAWGAKLQAGAQRAHDERRVPEGCRLQIVASRFGRAGWRWLGPGARVRAWQPAGGMKAATLHLLDEVLAGRRTPWS